MMKAIGHVRELVRYPIKSMAGTSSESAFLGWHGLNGDRRFAFRRLDDQSGFPWLTAIRLPELLLYHPFGLDESTGEPLPTHIRNPFGAEIELRSTALENEIGRVCGSNPHVPTTSELSGFQNWTNAILPAQFGEETEKCQGKTRGDIVMINHG